MKLVYILHAEDKMGAAASFQHRLRLLNQINSELTGAEAGDWRISVGIVRLNLKFKIVMIESQRVFEVVDFQKQ